MGEKTEDLSLDYQMALLDIVRMCDIGLLEGPNHRLLAIKNVAVSAFSADFKVAENEAQLRIDAALHGFTARTPAGQRIDPSSLSSTQPTGDSE